MSDSEGKDILFLQLVVLFKMKKKGEKEKYGYENYFVDMPLGSGCPRKHFLEILKCN